MDASQASACWQWYNWLSASAAAAGKQELLLNLDETSVPLICTHGGGNVMQLSVTKEWSRRPKQFASKSEQRSNFTHVGLICNDTHIQSLLPQVLFVADHLLNNTVFATIQAELPNNVYVKRMPKGWNNTEQHCFIIRILRLILAPFLARYQPILMFDAVPLHLAQEVMAELSRAAIWYLVIPARCTWLLQPLDTHGFAKYKLYLKNHFQDQGATAMDDHVTLRMIRLVVGAIRHVLQGFRWRDAFWSNGFSRGQLSASSYIKEHLEYDKLPAYSAERPSLEALRLCWPRNTRINEAVVWTALPADAAPAGPALLGPSVAALPLPAPPAGPGASASSAPAPTEAAFSAASASTASPAPAGLIAVDEDAAGVGFASGSESFTAAPAHASDAPRSMWAACSSWTAAVPASGDPATLARLRLRTKTTDF